MTFQSEQGTEGDGKASFQQFPPALNTVGPDFSEIYNNNKDSSNGNDRKMSGPKIWFDPELLWTNC